MKLKRRKKVFAAIVLVAMLSQTFTPVVTFALTSGPTQPEATSFEPVDTTDMVNMQTGSFTYNLPLLEVSGPEGGYPLSLSYHAGIQPNEDASWVGLGWTLNPGAINRSVNGYPDDWKDQIGTDHAFWEGGVRKSLSIGVSIPITGLAGVSFGLSFSHDTYLGFGVGGDIAAYWGVKLGTGVGLGGSVGIGVSPFGGPSLTSGLGLSYSQGVSGSLGVQVSTNFESLDAGVSGGVSYSISDNKQDTKGNLMSHNPSMGISLLGASISTSGDFTTSAAGFTSSIRNSNTSKIKTKSSGFSLGFISFNKTRYWIDERTNVVVHGSLDPSYAPHYTNQVCDTHDTYELLEDPEIRNIEDYPDPGLVQGGAFLDYDVYSVSGQGIGGNMRPYEFQGEAAGQDRNNGLDLEYRSANRIYGVPAFRFVGDFSSTYLQNYLPFTTSTTDPTGLAEDPVPFDGAPVYGNGADTAKAGSNVVNNIGTSTHINIGVKVLPYNILGYKKSDRYKSGMIEGFSMTNSSGVMYHYGLPAYSYGEEVYQKKIDDSKGISLNRQSKGTPYAYTWYLTTITGPDYVDRNNNQKADEGDWGYWVNFEYGKWSNDFIWRNPSEGYNRDEDNQFQNCSMGHKEVYYLNAIRTRSHIALFEKSIRQDGKGESASIFNKDSKYRYLDGNNFDANVAQSMRLDRIYLLNIQDGNIVQPSSGGVVARSSDLMANVLDKTDFDAVGRTALESKAIRVIDFGYDYSLCRGTANSFNIDAPLIKSGKLTLQSVVTRGKKGLNVLPAVKFSYGLSEGEVQKSTVTISGITGTSFSTLTTTNHNFKIGDLLETDETEPIFCGVIVDSLSNGVYKIANNSSGTGTKSIRTTNNPPYNKDAYDMWGMYKADINSVLLSKNENLGRATSKASNFSTDAWSLRKIITNTGAEMNINYESNSYNKSAIPNNHSLPVAAVSKVSSTEFKITTLDSNSVPLNQNLLVGETLDALLLTKTHNFYYFAGSIPSQLETDDYNTINTKNAVINAVIESVSANQIILKTTSNAINKYISSSVTSTINGPLGSYKTVTISSLGGNINVENGHTTYGGGVRVSSISISDMTGTVYQTKYDYCLPDSKISSGVTSYEPQTLNIDNMGSQPSGAKKAFRRQLYKTTNSLYALARELPPPGVMYEYVTVSNEVQHISDARPIQTGGRTTYRFEVFHSGMVNRKEVTPEAVGYQYSPSNIKNTARNFVIQKMTFPIGSLKSVAQYDNRGNKLTETINRYLYDGIDLDDSTACDQYKQRLDQRAQQLKYQGFLQERIVQKKIISNQPNVGQNGLKLTMTAREEYPSIQTGTTVINYVNGTRTNTETIGFDFYSGEVTKSIESDAYGNRIMTETVPAYRKYPSMGLKVNNINNKNMLSQTAATYVYKVNADTTKLGLISAEVNTWSNLIHSYGIDGISYVQNTAANGNVWRPQYTYSWRQQGKTADGLTSMTNFSDFWINPINPDVNWVKTSSVSRYDVYSKALEGTDINGNFATTHMNYNSLKVEASGVAAKYGEIAFSGAEDSSITQTSNPWTVKIGEGSLDTSLSNAHTGQRSLRLAAGKKGFVYSINTSNLTNGRSYLAYAWVKPSSGSITAQLYYSIGGTLKGSSTLSARKAGAWTLLTLLIKGADITTGQTLEVGLKNGSGSDVFGDDFRFQPVNGSSTAYVYDPFSGELRFILDANNLYTRYDYDAAGRVVATYREKFGAGAYKVSESVYNYGTLGIYINEKQSKEFTVSCNGVVGGGGTVTYSIPAGRYRSSVSQADANAKALDALDKEGQAYANASFACPIQGAFLYLTLPTNTPSGPPYLVVAWKNLETGSEASQPFFTAANYSLYMMPGTYNFTFSIPKYNGYGFSYVRYYKTGEVKSGATAEFDNITISASAPASFDVY